MAAAGELTSASDAGNATEIVLWDKGRVAICSDGGFAIATTLLAALNQHRVPGCVRSVHLQALETKGPVASPRGRAA